MSFGDVIKEELLKHENKKRCCNIAELSGIICMGITLFLSDGKNCMKFTTENEAAAKRFVQLLKYVFKIKAEVVCKKSRTIHDGNIYTVKINNTDTEKIISGLKLYDVEFVQRTMFYINRNTIKQHCCKKAFLRGAFLGSASIVNPEKGYHIEFITKYKRLTEDFCSLLSEFGLKAKITVRKQNNVIYFNSAEEIGDILSAIGAHKALMEFMNVKIIKETRNNLNRKMNCESANQDKSMDAAVEQSRAVIALKKRGFFDTLTDAEKQLAELRLVNLDKSLKELGEMMTPPISKSAVNHRFRKIMEKYRKMEDTNE